MSSHWFSSFILAAVFDTLVVGLVISPICVSYIFEYNLSILYIIIISYFIVYMFSIITQFMLLFLIWRP